MVVEIVRDGFFSSSTLLKTPRWSLSALSARDTGPSHISTGGVWSRPSRLRYRDLQQKVVDHFHACAGDDEGVVEENAEQAVGHDRIGFGHDHHAGLEDVQARLGF